jgi:alpha-beta hydrolase superfamily lysophospholipase
MAKTPVIFRLATDDGTLLHAEVMEPEFPPRAVVVWVHGFGEHIGRYRRVSEALVGQGIATLGIDLRGHGHSTGTRSFVRTFSDYEQDVAAARGEALRRWPSVTPTLVGHSMGGVIAALSAEKSPEGVRGLALSSPAFKVAAKVPAWKVLLAKSLAKPLPKIAVPAGIPPEHLSRDPEVGRRYTQDVLVNKNATAGWYVAYLAAQDEALRRAPELRLPLLVMYAGDDRIADKRGAQEFFDRAGSTDKQQREFAGAYHEIFNETNQLEVFGVLASWLVRS